MEIEACGCPFVIPFDVKPGDEVRIINALSCEGHVERTATFVGYGERLEIHQSQ